MNLMNQEQGFEEFAAAPGAAEDRRIHDRLTLMKTLQIFDFDSGQLLETTTVVDISREGLYFLTRSPLYRIGMKVNLAIPSLQFEGSCEVVRIEKLPTGYLGVGGFILAW
jgi:hypothetical protein